MAKREARERYDVRVTAIAAALTVACIVYWAMYAANAYNTFHYYSDFVIFANNVYLYFNYPSVAPGLQYLIYGNHISLDMVLFVMPAYALYQSPFALLYVQDIAVCLAGLALFFAVRNLTGRQYLALAFALAFFLNPGIHGLTIYDFHTESFIPLFYIMTFYFAMTTRMAPFFASLTLLLGSLESTVVMALMLGIGLWAYERWYDKDGPLRKRRFKTAKLIIAASLIAAAVYYLMTVYLANAYTAGPYAVVPAGLRVTIGSQNNVVALALSHIESPQSVIEASYQVAEYLPGLVAFGLLTAFASFGIALFLDFGIALLLLAPYLAGVVFSFKYLFLLTYVQYFAFAIPCTAVAAVLGYLSVQNMAHKNADRAKRRKRLMDLMLWSCVVASAALCLVSPLYIVNRNLPSVQAAFLFQNSAQTIAVDAQADSMLALIPHNATVMAMIPLVSHLSQRKNVTSVSTNPPFSPEYIVVDPNYNLTENWYLWYGPYINYTGNNAYYLVAENGTARLYKRE